MPRNPSNASIRLTERVEWRRRICLTRENPLGAALAICRSYRALICFEGSRGLEVRPESNPGTLDDPDVDGDGYGICTDCDDSDSAINPGAVDIPGNGIDEDCVDGDAVIPPVPTLPVSGLIVIAALMLLAAIQTLSRVSFARG